MKPLITREYLYQYFEGKATSIQKQQIDEWINDSVNQEFFYECLAQWEEQHLQHWAPAKQGYKRHLARMSKIKEKEDIEEPAFFLPQKKSFNFMIAASVALLCLTGLGFIYKDSIFNRKYLTAFGETRKIILDDGSEVFLNANSSLTIPRFGFYQHNRSVSLSGEAMFSVKHLPDNQHFIVKTDKQFEVEVLGTEFLVFSRERGGKVVLSKGKVRFRGADKQISMNPGDLVIIGRQGEISVSHSKNPESFSFWKENRFVFEETSLEELAYIFKENFDITLIIPNKTMANWTISGSFTAKNADELLETIAIASNLDFKREGKKVIIVQP